MENDELGLTRKVGVPEPIAEQADTDGEIGTRGYMDSALADIRTSVPDFNDIQAKWGQLTRQERTLMLDQIKKERDWLLKQTKMALIFDFAYSVLGLILGLLRIIGGIVLFFQGVEGESGVEGSVLGLTISLKDAAPGVILFFVGLFLVWVTKYKANIQVGQLWNTEPTV